MPWFVSLIITIITNLPNIISIIKSIVSLIHNVVPPAAQPKAWADLAGAVSAYKETKDPAQLKALHDQLSAVGNPPDLV